MGILDTVLQKQKTNAVPLWMMRQAGRYLPEYRKIREQAGDFLNLCYTPDLATEVTLQPIKRFNYDAAIIFSDILVIPNALGLNVKFEKNEGPIVEKVTSFEDLNKLSLSRVVPFLEPVLQAVRQTRSNLDPTKDLIGFIGAPWTLATYMIEGKSKNYHEITKRFSYENETLFLRILDLITDALILFVKEKIKNGANIIQIFDSWASFLTEEQFLKYVIRPTEKIIHNVKQDYPNIPIIGFPRGIGYHAEAYKNIKDLNGLGCDISIPLHKMAEWGDTITVQGNLDPLLLLKGGQDLVNHVKKMLHLLKDKHYIFNLGHGILPETPINHVEQVVALVKEQL